VAVNDYHNAFVLALSMEQPGRLLKLFQSLTLHVNDGDNESITGSLRVDETIASLSQEDLGKLLRHVRTWNTSSKTSEVAQRVLYALLKLRHHEDLIEIDAAVYHKETFEHFDKGSVHPRMQELIEGLIPYTERHLHRLDRLVQESYVIDHIIGEMDDGLIEID
jgi:U3 small nucleolar RNA-associated protein 13